MAVIDKVFIGKFVNMRCVDINDADFILKLRLCPENAKMLGETQNDIEIQKNWIKNQRQKDNDYYFIFENKSAEKLGTIGSYNIIDNIAESGRYVSLGQPQENLNAVLLHYDFLFYDLSIDLFHFTVYRHNPKVIKMWLKLGSIIKHEEIINGMPSSYFEVTKSTYDNVFRPKLIKLLSDIN